MTEFNQVTIRKVENGYRVNTQTLQKQSEYVFNNYSDLQEWLRKYFEEESK